MRGFVGVDRAAERDAIVQAAHAFVFALGDEDQRVAATLADDDDDAALAGLVLRAATVTAILFVVGRADVAARVHDVDLDFADLLALIGSAHRFVGENELRLVLAVQIAA